MIFAEVKASGKRELATVDPLEFAGNYACLSEFYYENNRHECDYRNFCHDYFMLCLRHCEETGDINTASLAEDLFSMYELLVALDDSKLNSYRLELKQKLISTAESEDASALLGDALEKARKSETLWSFYNGHKLYLRDDRVEPRRQLKKPNLPG